MRYAEGAGAAHELDVYVPDKPAAGARPLVVFWYGGRWTDGDKSDYRFVGAALASLGCVAMLPNYRHYPEVKLAGFMADAAEATHWAVAHARDYGCGSVAAIPHGTLGRCAHRGVAGPRHALFGRGRAGGAVDRGG